MFFFFFQAEDGIRDADVTGVQTCALPISISWRRPRSVVAMRPHVELHRQSYPSDRRELAAFEIGHRHAARRRVDGRESGLPCPRWRLAPSRMAKHRQSRRARGMVRHAEQLDHRLRYVPPFQLGTRSGDGLDKQNFSNAKKISFCAVDKSER